MQATSNDRIKAKVFSHYSVIKICFQNMWGSKAWLHRLGNQTMSGNYLQIFMLQKYSKVYQINCDDMLMLTVFWSTKKLCSSLTGR